MLLYILISNLLGKILVFLAAPSIYAPYPDFPSFFAYGNIFA